MAVDQNTENYIKFPFGEQDVQAIAYAATVAAELTNSKTLIKTDPTGAFILAITLKSGVNFFENGGEVLTVMGTSDGAHAVTLGAGFGGPDPAALAAAHFVLKFERKDDGLFYLTSQA